MTTYYISPTGSDTNPGTQTQPFKTIQKGISAAQTNDTVQVLPGTYYQTNTTGKVTINKSISVIGSGRSNTIIDGSQITNYSDGWTEGLVEITGNNNYFGGFTIQNAINGLMGSAGIIIYSCDNNTVEKNLIQYAFDSGIKVFGSQTSGHKSYNNTIRYNELYRCVWGGDPNISRQENLSCSFVDTTNIYYNYLHEDGFSGTTSLVGGEGIMLKDGSYNCVVHHNYVYKQIYTGIIVDDASSNTQVYNNIVERTSHGGDGAPNHGDGLDACAEGDKVCDQANIHDNIVYNTYNGLTICCYHNPSYATGTVSNITMNNNIAYVDDPTIPQPTYDLNVQNCGDNMSNISVTNNYAHGVYIDSSGIMPNGQTIASILTLSGNNQNLTDITNQFNAKYSILKTDILNHVFGGCIPPTCDFQIT